MELLLYTLVHIAFLGIALKIFYYVTSLLIKYVTLFLETYGLINKKTYKIFYVDVNKRTKSMQIHNNNADLDKSNAFTIWAHVTDGKVDSAIYDPININDNHWLYKISDNIVPIKFDDEICRFKIAINTKIIDDDIINQILHIIRVSTQL